MRKPKQTASTLESEITRKLFLSRSINFSLSRAAISQSEKGENRDEGVCMCVAMKRALAAELASIFLESAIFHRAAATAFKTDGFPAFCSLCVCSLSHSLTIVRRSLTGFTPAAMA